MIAIEDLAEQSIMLNAISGCAMFVGSLYLMRYYYAEHMTRLHALYSDESPLKRSLVHAGLAAGPYLILLLICRGLPLQDKLQCAAHFPFINLALCLIPLAILAKEHLPLDYRPLSQLVCYSISTSAIAVVGALNKYFAASAIAAQTLASLYFMRSARDFAFARVPELSYALSPFLRGILSFIRDVLYPFELVLDYSIVTQGAKNREWMPSLPVRAFISPYVNASLLIVYYRFAIPLSAMLLLSATTFCIAVLLFLCARKEKHIRCIHCYSFAVVCAYLYAIMDEQLRITGFISRRAGCQFTTAAVWYAMPHVCLGTLLLNAFVHSTGQKQVSLFGAFFTHAFYSLVLFCASVVYGFVFPGFSVIGNKLFLVGVALSLMLSLTALYYTSKYSRHFTDLFCITAFYIVVHVNSLLY